MKRKKMAVIRGTRVSEGIFYNAFKNLEIKFLFHSPEKIYYPIKLENLEFGWLPQKPAFLIDPIKWLYPNKFSFRSWLKADLDVLRKQLEDVDVVNITDAFYVWWQGVAKLIEEMKIPLITIIWETLPDHPSTYIPPYCLSVKKVVKTTSRYFLKTQRCYRFTDSLGIPREKTRVIYQGIDLEMFGPKTEKVSTGIKILYVGRLISHKGVGELLEAVDKLAQEYQEVELIIAGDGPLKRRIKRQAERLPIKYLKAVPYQQMPQVYQQADIYCLPSKDYRYFGLLPGGEERGAYTLLEAMACGLPVVTTRCGSNQELVGDKNIIVEQGDSTGLFQAFKKLIANPERRRQLGRFNRLRAEKMFELKTQARKMEKAIMEIL